MQQITRAELVDYLDQRERITASVLERIERRLESIEQRVDAASNTPVPQDSVTLEQGRKRRRDGNKSDPRLRVCLQLFSPTRPRPG